MTTRILCSKGFVSGYNLLVFQQRIKDIKQHTLAGLFPDGQSLFNEIENSELPNKVKDWLQTELSKALECYPREKSPL